MNRFLTIAAAAGLVCAAAFSAQAQDAPAGVTIPIQGVLTDVEGKAIDESVAVTFSLYDSPFTTQPFWAEVQTVDVISGLFSTYLGTNVELGPELFQQNQIPYLGIRVKADQELGRWPIASAPYAATSRFADQAIDSQKLGGKTAAELGSVKQITAGSGLSGGSITTTGTIAIANEAVTSAMITNATIQIGDLNFDPATQAEFDALKTGTAVNTASNLVDWRQLKNVPADFADGVDAAGGLANDLSCTACVAEGDLAGSAVTSTKIQSGAVTSSHIADGTITTADLAAGTLTVSGGNIVDGSITSADLSAASVSASNITADAITSAKILDGTIQTGDLNFDPATQTELNAMSTQLKDANGVLNAAANPVDWSQLKNVPPTFADGVDAAGGVANDIACTGCVGGSDIATSTVAEGNLAFDPATQTELNSERSRIDTVVGSMTTLNSNLASSGTVNTATNPVDFTKLKSVPTSILNGQAASVVCTGCVDTVDISATAVTDAKLADGAVTNAKLATDAVTNAKLANDAVTSAELASGAVTSAKLADGAVTTAKINAGAVDGTKIATTSETTMKTLTLSGAPPAGSQNLEVDGTTRLGSGGTAFGKILFGKVSTSSNTGTVNFGTSFSGDPTVVLTVESGSGDNAYVNLSGVSSTSFSFTTWDRGTTVTINWIAIGN